MPKQPLTNISPQAYEHPFDRQALISLEKMPGISLLFKKINEYGIDRLLRFKFGAIAMRVSEGNFPDLHSPFVAACETLEIEPIPELYLLHGTGYIRTIIIGANKPMVIVNVDGMEKLSQEELIYALGHELGHIKSNHLLYHQTAMILPALGKVIANSTLGLGGLATNGVELALFQWVMMAKLTCDRAALLACQDVDVAIRTLIKLAGLPGEHITPTVVEEFIAQAKDFGSYDLDNLDKITKMLSFMEPLHPWTTLRASELLKWVDSGEYQDVLEGKIPESESVPETPKEDEDWGDEDEDWDQDVSDNSSNQETKTNSGEGKGEEWDFLSSW